MGRLVIYSLSLLFIYLFHSANGIEEIHPHRERNYVQEYDFIVVGSGAAGSVVATRLAKEFPWKTVLVVEAGVQAQRELGGTDFVATKTKIDPNSGEKMLDPIPWTRYDIGAYSSSIRTGSWFLNNTWGINGLGTNSQAKVVGGNMAANGMSWIYAYKYDFDSWGLPGYTAADIWPLYKRMENVSGTEWASDPSHGLNGPIKSSGPTFWAADTLKFYNACRAYGFADLGDPNDGEIRQGVGFNMANQRDGIRESSSVSYLAPTLRSRRNLKLVRGCTVTQVLFGRAPWANKKVRGVECVDLDGDTRRFYANYEVILSAGPLQTPKILFNSGIGPLSVLTAFNKPQRYVNELIGQQIRNHQSMSVQFNDPGQINANFFYLPVATIQFAAEQTGIYGNPATVRLMAKVNASHPYPDTSMQIIFGTLSPSGGAYSQILNIYITQTYQEYKYGALNLTSSDPLANSTFNAHLWENLGDVETMAQSIILARNIVNTHWPNAVVETSPGAEYATVEDLVPIIQSMGGSVCHFYGSVPIGDTTDSPLDLRMRVRTITGLRVVDASVIPGHISQGMQAQAVVMGEKGADLIIEDYPQFTV